MSKITRRSFIQKAGLFTAGGAAISADLPGYKSNTANAQVLPEWLNLTQETALEPDLPIIDPHHHFWDRPKLGKSACGVILVKMTGGVRENYGR